MDDEFDDDYEDHKHEDREFEDHLITEVRGNESGWTLDMDGLCFHCPIVSDTGEPVDPPPAAGMTARMYGKGFGYTVRGLYLNDQLDRVQRVFYRTPEQQEQKHRDWCAEQNRVKLALFEANREELDRRFAALPEIFQRRIQKFRNTNPEFRWEYEDYEMFCCEQAVIYARMFPTVEELSAFHQLPWDQQVAKFEEGEQRGAFEGHSGNTFGFACALARHYITNPENVYREHGALVPMVGCEAYGCPHPHQEREALVACDAYGHFPCGEDRTSSPREQTLAEIVAEAGEAIADKILNGTDTGTTGNNGN